MPTDKVSAPGDQMTAAPDASFGSEPAAEVVNVIEERLNVVKRVVDSGGGVRLRKVVHRDAVDVAEPLILETLNVKRVSINRDVDGPIGVRYEGDTTVFSILEERLVTRRQLVLVEEIHVTKTARVDRTIQPITLRREEVIIERQDPASGKWSVIGAADAPTPSST